MNRQPIILVAAMLCLAAGLPALGQVRDQERVIDVQSLSEAIAEATEPIGRRMQQSRLKERFDQVNQILEAKEVDKVRLIESLKALKGEMDQFTANWNEATDPLWQAQENIAQTVDRVRLLLARGPSGQPSEKTQALLNNYDARLTNLAQAIKAEQDEQRKARLKLIFSNVLALRKLTEQTGSINLDPAREAVYAKIIAALTSLETQLTAATFQIERARVLLVSESEFIGNYVAIMEGLVEAENLAKMLADMKSSGNGIGNLTLDVNELTQQVEQFATMMDGFATKLADNIEAETARAAAELETTELDGVNVDDAIEQYAAPKTSTPPAAGSQRGAVSSTR